MTNTLEVLAFIVLCLTGGRYQCQRYFKLAFPMEQLDERLTMLIKDYFRQTKLEELNWQDIIMYIPKEMWEKHGFYEVINNFDYPTAVPVCKEAYDYVIEPRDKRLMEATRKIEIFAMEHYHLENLEECSAELQEVISDFTLKCGQDYVVFGDGDVEFDDDDLRKHTEWTLGRHPIPDSLVQSGCQLKNSQL